ncbi:hypothetical protein K402DRAFT_176192 [Aulographum hederae CBS 113979]|uniref:Uncharacterized protein n=1 Tax=Aulographum hederae CBS 113979 TaxID=1176131 RepID=A0A6G1GR44_9PEZI|nr:hypothetical protein K402DRAFT_176192 [Aulographum hederae CBS 113979]
MGSYPATASDRSMQAFWNSHSYHAGPASTGFPLNLSLQNPIHGRTDVHTGLSDQYAPLYGPGGPNQSMSSLQMFPQSGHQGQFGPSQSFRTGGAPQYQLAFAHASREPALTQGYQMPGAFMQNQTHLFNPMFASPQGRQTESTQIFQAQTNQPTPYFQANPQASRLSQLEAIPQAPRSRERPFIPRPRLYRSNGYGVLPQTCSDPILSLRTRLEILVLIKFQQTYISHGRNPLNDMEAICHAARLITQTAPESQLHTLTTVGSSKFEALLAQHSPLFRRVLELSHSHAPLDLQFLDSYFFPQHSAAQMLRHSRMTSGPGFEPAPRVRIKGGSCNNAKRVRDWTETETEQSRDDPESKANQKQSERGAKRVKTEKRDGKVVIKQEVKEEAKEKADEEMVETIERAIKKEPEEDVKTEAKKDVIEEVIARLNEWVEAKEKVKQETKKKT